MAAIQLKAFVGQVPFMEPQALPEMSAFQCIDAWLRNGTIEPILSEQNAASLISAYNWSGVISRYRPYPSNPNTVYWVYSNLNNVSIVPSPIANDRYSRLFICENGDTAPGVPNKIRYQMLGNVFPAVNGDVLNYGVGPFPPALGVPAPTVNARIFPAGGGAHDLDNVDTRFYVATWVDNLGQESAPSNPVGPFSVTPYINGLGETVIVTITPPAQYWDYAYSGSKYRIYRTSTSGSGTEYQFVGETPFIENASSVFNDMVGPTSLGEVLPSTDWALPPEGLWGIVSAPGGFLIGWQKNALWFSEPGFPHAWPVKYQRSVDYPIVGLEVFGNSILIATTGQPYMAQGTDPMNMAIQKIEAPFPCVSRNSIVDLGDKACYASRLGLVSASASGVDLVTKMILKKEQWQAMRPETMRAVYWEGRYLCWFDNPGNQSWIPQGANAFSILPGGEVDGIAFYSIPARIAYRDIFEDQVYFMKAGDSNIYKWNTGTPKTAYWWSKHFLLPKPANFAAIYVNSKGGAVGVDHFVKDQRIKISSLAYLSADSEQKALVVLQKYRPDGTLEQTYTSTAYMGITRLPATRVDQVHSFLLTTAGPPILSMAIATSVNELKDV